MERELGKQTEEGYTTEILTGAALVPVNRDAAPMIGAATEELEEMRRQEDARRKQ
ncbi:hypothetical protein [Priestia abyssalis]|uniref:hypothetical protein n=1 Tax=Priestia abyssalis TaxID=1221450 RepID=UPI00147460AE|nr:hypothetical protein [Priestia abyssalis]